MIGINKINLKLKIDLENLKNNESIIIKSYKKDRVIDIKKISDKFEVNENGFKNVIYTFNEYKHCYKEVIKIIKHEFPNSSMLWYSIRNC